MCRGLIGLAELLQLKQLTAAQLEQAQRRDALIVDTRAAEQFASCHIVGAVQIGLVGPFASWAAILIKPTQRILLVAEDANRALEAHNRLARVGFKDVIGYALADENQWRRQGIALTSLPIWRCEDVRLALQQGRPFQLVDVRSRAEWSQGRLPGAISMPLLEFDPEAPSIDFSEPSLLYCREGYRAMTAASMLLRRNHADIVVLIAPLDACTAAGPTAEIQEPTEQPVPCFTGCGPK
jgi:rhodanese-related sulfurtransferase